VSIELPERSRSPSVVIRRLVTVVLACGLSIWTAAVAALVLLVSARCGIETTCDDPYPLGQTIVSAALSVLAVGSSLLALGQLFNVGWRRQRAGLPRLVPFLVASVVFAALALLASPGLHAG
jgi:uncharacterized membrane protein